MARLEYRSRPFIYYLHLLLHTIINFLFILALLKLHRRRRVHHHRLERIRTLLYFRSLRTAGPARRSNHVLVLHRRVAENAVHPRQKFAHKLGRRVPVLIRVHLGS